MIVLGVDPGEDGGAALVNDRLELIELLPFKGTQFPPALLTMAQKADVIYFEHVHSMPGQGVASTFTFGRMTGLAEAAIILSGKPRVNVEPQAWQNRLRLPRHRDIIESKKRRTAQRKDQERFAREWYPKALGNWNTKKDGDIYGAVLIARAGAMLTPRYMQQQLDFAPQTLGDLL